MDLRFENDVKMYGIQTLPGLVIVFGSFENDVKMYGIQTDAITIYSQKCLRMM